jgi:hypothetical protein
MEDDVKTPQCHLSPAVPLYCQSKGLRRLFVVILVAIVGQLRLTSQGKLVNHA